MPDLLSTLKRVGVRPAVRRVLAVDAGSRRLKLLLVESGFGRVRVLEEEMIDLQAEGLVSADETRAHLEERLGDWGDPPVALALPQHVSISQIIELPAVPEPEVQKLLRNETAKLAGVSETRIVQDFVRLGPAGADRQQYWVTLCPEAEIRERILQLGIEREDLCEVTTVANALITAYRALSPLAARAILVHLGAQTTVVVVLLGGHGAFVTSFQMGSDFFTRSLARALGCAEEKAERLKREQNLLSGAEACPAFVADVEGWATELKRQLNEWFERNPPLAAEVASFPLIASGGGFDQLGLLDYLRREAGLGFASWPSTGRPELACPSRHFEVGFGAALQALGKSAQPVSLLPEDYRAEWRRRQARQRWELASAMLAVVCALLLAVGTWQQISQFFGKRALRAKVGNSLEAVRANEAAAVQLVGQYENLRPLLASQQASVDTLNTLALLQQTRSNRSFWYVLLADQQSYFSQPLVASTNKAARTNLVFMPPPAEPVPTNLALAKPGLIAELCVPEDPEATRRVLGQLVHDLREQRIFSWVDQLPEDQRRGLAEPKVLIPEKRFALRLDFATTDFEQALTLAKVLGTPPRAVPKRPPRSGRTPSEGEAPSATP